MKTARLLVAVSLVGLFSAACDDKRALTNPAALTIVVSPNPHTMAVGTTQQFTAAGRDFNGGDADITPTWSVVAGGGTISSSGVFTAGTVPGTFTSTVQAQSNSIRSTATVTVTAGPIATIAITPTPVTLARSATQQYIAVAKDAYGNDVAFTPVWSVAAGGGTINADGLFTAGLTSGTFTNTVVATSGSINATGTVTVLPGALATIAVTPNPATLAISATQQFTATGRDASGNAVAITPAWSVLAGGGTIGAASGLFTAGTSAGAFTNTVLATSGGITGSATVNVVAGPLATIVVSPNPANMLVNATAQFTATGTDAGGNAVTFTPAWSVVNGGGSIGATSGLFTAGAVAGTFANTVRATSGSLSGTASVVVSPIVVIPPPAGGGIDLGAAAANGIMAGTAVTCVNLGAVNADVSISPGNTLTGFGPCTISGTRHLNDGPAIQAQIDLTTAFNTLAGMACPPANAIVANLGGTTKRPGVYCSASGIGVTGTLTLDGNGDPNAVFVFQAGSSLTTAGSIVLIGGAQASNVYWLVGSSATIGTASAWQGNIIALTSITLVDTATLIGRALARNGAVSLGTGNTINLP